MGHPSETSRLVRRCGPPGRFNPGPNLSLTHPGPSDEGHSDERIRNQKR